MNENELDPSFVRFVAKDEKLVKEIEEISRLGAKTDRRLGHRSHITGKEQHQRTGKPLPENLIRE